LHLLRECANLRRATHRLLVLERARRGTVTPLVTGHRFRRRAHVIDLGLEGAHDRLSWRLIAAQFGSRWPVLRGRLWIASGRANGSRLRRVGKIDLERYQSQRVASDACHRDWSA